MFYPGPDLMNLSQVQKRFIYVFWIGDRGELRTVALQYLNRQYNV